ncbi:ATP-binding protein [Streptomyces uncialis]|uniref:ATP-binding protein n=1 Tax=Streptomyces uncialis TaxID=1048205 RepID=UPI0037B4D457|nr:ATP-binding protein [Streptomyces uncialis]
MGLTRSPAGTAALNNDEWSMTYAMVPRVVSLARRHTQRFVERVGWKGDADVAVLVVSELVTNAVRYARVPGRALTLRLRAQECGGLRVDVSDPLPDFPCFDGDATRADDEGGRGLPLVRLLSELSWRPDPDGRGKTVRACLPPSPG